MPLFMAAAATAARSTHGLSRRSGSIFVRTQILVLACVAKEIRSPEGGIESLSVKGVISEAHA